jgi:hypothetical protein
VIDFSNIKGITIPQGKVKDISVGGVKVWKEQTTPIEDIKGTWVFDSFPILDSGGLSYFAGNVNFTSNGQTFTYLSTKSRVIYYNTTKVFDESTRWANENYRTITITDSISEVINGEDLLKTLKVLATKQSKATIYFNMIQDLNNSSNLESFLFMQQCFQAAQGESCKFNEVEITSDTLSINESGNLYLFYGTASTYEFSLDTVNTIYLNDGETFTVNYTITKQSSTTGDRVGAKTIKVVLNPKIITFTIHTYYQGSLDQTNTYQAYEGMTWEEWVNSSFNTKGYWVQYENDIRRKYRGNWAVLDNVIASNILTANTVYSEQYTNVI